MPEQRCPRCGVTVRNLARKPVKWDCALFEPPDDEHYPAMCDPMQIQLLQSALLRAVLPEAFDATGRIKEGMLIPALTARDAAMRQAAALRGPVSVDDFKVNTMEPQGTD